MRGVAKARPKAGGRGRAAGKAKVAKAARRTKVAPKAKATAGRAKAAAAKPQPRPSQRAPVVKREPGGAAAAGAAPPGPPCGGAAVKRESDPVAGHPPRPSCSSGAQVPIVVKREPEVAAGGATPSRPREPVVKREPGSGATPGSSCAGAAAAEAAQALLLARRRFPAPALALVKEAPVTRSRARLLVEDSSTTSCTSSSRPDGSRVSARTAVAERRLYSAAGHAPVETTSTARGEQWERWADGSCTVTETIVMRRVRHLRPLGLAVGGGGAAGGACAALALPAPPTSPAKRRRLSVA